MTTSDRGPGIRFPPPLVFLGFGLLGWTGQRLIGLGAWSLPGWACWTVAGVLFVAGVALATGAIRRFREARTPPEPWKPTTAITDRAPYSFTRNPMYLGMGCVHLAVGVGLQSTGILLSLFAVFITMDRLVVRREEAYLFARFGDAYAAYQANVRRWL